VGANQETALRFLAATNAMTASDETEEQVLSFFTHESVFENIPLDPAAGSEQIWKLLDLGASGLHSRPSTRGPRSKGEAAARSRRCS